MGNPTKIDLDLRVRGYHLLAICRNTATFPEEVKNKLWCWSRMLRLAGDEQSVSVS